jgi:hypothetical protein
MENRLSQCGDSINRNQAASFLPARDDLGELRTQWNYAWPPILADLAGDAEFVAVDHAPSERSDLTFSLPRASGPIDKIAQPVIGQIARTLVISSSLKNP